MNILKNSKVLDALTVLAALVFSFSLSEAIYVDAFTWKLCFSFVVAVILGYSIRAVGELRDPLSYRNCRVILWITICITVAFFTLAIWVGITPSQLRIFAVGWIISMMGAGLVFVPVMLGSDLARWWLPKITS